MTHRKPALFPWCCAGEQQQLLAAAQLQLLALLLDLLGPVDAPPAAEQHPDQQRAGPADAMSRNRYVLCPYEHGLAPESGVAVWQGRRPVIR